MRRMWTALTLTAALAANTAAAGAQERRPAPPPHVEVEDLVIAPPAGEIKGDTFIFISTEMGFGGKVVKGAPYSAQAVTETVQTLADGNRIVRKNSANVYRDSEGRTRREQSLSHVGPFATAGDAAQTTFINDPVAGVHYILDPRGKTARKLPVVGFEFRTGHGEAGARVRTHREVRVEEKVRVEEDVRFKEGDGAAHGFVFTAPAPPAPGAPHGAPEVMFMRHPAKGETKTEKLEKRVVEGVEAEGQRTVTTIPAGEIGNEQPIQIVHETWYSPELQLIVMTRHSDPRAGETTYRLTNINRGEPGAALFQIPGDYNVRESPAPPRTFRRARRPVAPAEN
ncbi:MAG TPA: hypothetical protein VN228_03140 [Pyrinomonadaceae bacterium]|nr:hypothetical protein [Pyrinomonadaceae bacterium]